MAGKISARMVYIATHCKKLQDGNIYVNRDFYKFTKLCVEFDPFVSADEILDFWDDYMKSLGL